MNRRTFLKGIVAACAGGAACAAMPMQVKGKLDNASLTGTSYEDMELRCSIGRGSHWIVDNPGLTFRTYTWPEWQELAHD